MTTIIPDYKHKIARRLKFIRDHYKNPIKLIAKTLLQYPFNSLSPDRLYLSMLSISTKLSQDFKFIRVDLYSVKNKIYFGELTFHHGSGYDGIYPDQYDFWLGDLIKLDN